MLPHLGISRASAPTLLLGMQNEFIGSKTECALLGFVEKLSGNYDDVRQKLQIAQLYPFSSERKRMSTLLEPHQNNYRLYTKVQLQLNCTGSSLQFLASFFPGRFLTRHFDKSSI